MQTEDMMKIDGFSYRGITVPAIEAYRDPVIDKGEGNAYELGQDSGPLSWKVAFYNVGRDLKWSGEGVPGLEDVHKLPENAKEYGRIVYTRAQKKAGEGTWHKGAVLFEPEVKSIPGLWKPKGGYIAARFFPEGFVKVSDDKYELNEDGCEGRLWLPPGDGSFVVPVQQGTHYHNGLVIATVPDYKEAVNAWMKTGLTETQAKNEISRHYRRGSGFAPVLSRSGGYVGPLVVGLGNVPSDGDPLIGRFPASVAERSEAGARRRGA